MKKKMFAVYLVILVFVVLNINIWAASGYAHCNYQYNDNTLGGFYHSANVIHYTLEGMGYNTYLYHEDGDDARFQIAWRNIVYLVGHSGAGYQGCEPGGVTINSTSNGGAPLADLGNLANSRLVYFSGCHSGDYDSAQGWCLDTYAHTMRGVDATFSYMDEVYTSGPYGTTGFLWFDQEVFYLLSLGCTLGQAADYAYAELLAQGGGSYGCDSYWIYGYNVTIN